MFKIVGLLASLIWANPAIGGQEAGGGPGLSCDNGTTIMNADVAIAEATFNLIIPDMGKVETNNGLDSLNHIGLPRIS